MYLTKELLSEVLMTPIETNYNIDCFGSDNMLYGDDFIPISKFELAYKCKEWAYDLDYVLTSQYQYDYKEVTQIPKAVVFIDNPKFETREIIYASNEIEAIFKVCQWILDQSKNTKE